MVAPTINGGEKSAPLPEVTLVPYEPIEPTAQTWSRKELVLSVIGFFCCHLVGLPALIMAIFSYVDFSNKAFTESQAKRKRAKRLGIAAIVLGLMMILMMVAYFRYCPHARHHHHHEDTPIKDRAFDQMPPRPQPVANAPRVPEMHRELEITGEIQIPKRVGDKLREMRQRLMESVEQEPET